MIREFKSGANRDVATWKMQVSKYSNPLNDFSYNQYMLSKQQINWVFREWDNRQKWIPEDVLFESLCRHIEELKLLLHWYDISEIRKDGAVNTVVWEYTPKDWEEVIKKTIVETLNAIRFNSEWLKLHHLQREYGQWIHP